jgi:hypothetical protein
LTNYMEKVRQNLIDLAIPSENEVWLVLEIIKKDGRIEYEELLKAAQPIAGVTVLDIVQAAERLGFINSSTPDRMIVRWIGELKEG